VNPSQEEMDVCGAFFPESELSDIVHAATCLYADAILITNDAHFNKIRKLDSSKSGVTPRRSKDSSMK
jgi:hypothetical protein